MNINNVIKFFGELEIITLLFGLQMEYTKNCSLCKRDSPAENKKYV